MKKNHYTLLISTALLSSSAFALTTKDSPIQRVTLYPNGALIERDIAVRAGEKLVTLSGLPANFSMDNVQIQTVGVDVAAVTNHDSAIDKPSGRESQQLKQRIQDTQQQLAELNAKIQAAELQNKFLTNLTTGNATAVRQQAYEAFLAISKLTPQKNDLEQRLKELNQDLNQIGDNRFNQRTLNLHVNAPQAGTIHLRYQVPYATWRPSYKAELNSQTGQLKLSRMAEIQQKTGEDWDNVQLVLSTNIPQAQVAQVEPTSWWVNYHEPYPDRPSPVMMKSARMELAAAPVAEEQADAGFPQFSPVEQSYSSEFTATKRTSIASSQQNIALPLDEQHYTAQLATWVIPQQQETAFLVAQLPRLVGDYPTGSMKLYRDGDYIGEQRWQNSQTEQLFIHFGEDSRTKVVVTRTPTQYDKTGALSKQTLAKQHKHYQITNLHRQPISLTVFESVPQSQNTALKVNAQFSQNPTATSWQGQQGIYQWQQALAPQTPFDLDIDYQLRYPSEGTISGF